MAPLLHLGSPMNLVILGLIAGVIYLVGAALYNLFLHPLRSYPGPLLWRASPIPRYLRLWNGDLSVYVLELQKQYGPVIRICPNELAYTDAQAWKDIYGHRSHGQPEFGKYMGFYKLFSKASDNVLTETREAHGHLRRALAHGFSEKAMQGQESIIGNYVDLFIQRLHENVKGGAAILNMRDWYNYVTFDVIGDLGFGAPFGALENSSYHPWIRLITHSIRQNAGFQAIKGVFGSAPIELIYQSGRHAFRKHQTIVQEKLAERIELGDADRPDLIGPLINRREDLELDFPKLSANAGLLIIAGSETTATLLSGVSYLLTTNPEKLRLLVREVRQSFASEEEITLLSVNKLSYMLACLNEGLRLYPPVATGMPRVVPKGGATVAGKFVPEGTVVAVWSYAISRRAEYWTEPNSFVPERWQDDPRYKGDVKDSMQPFSTGPRNCVGRNLAYAEMRLILARIIYNFDMELEERSRNWLEEQKVYTIWDKPQLHLRLTPVEKKGEKASLI